MSSTPGEPSPWGTSGPPPPLPGGQPPYGWGPAHPVPEHPQATTALVLGILGILVCGVISPFAWRIGKRAVDEIDASRGQLGGRGSAQAGYVLGLVGTVLLGFAALALVLGGIAVLGLALTSVS